jgi:hypothetical protein
MCPHRVVCVRLKNLGTSAGLFDGDVQRPIALRLGSLFGPRLEIGSVQITKYVDTVQRCE